MLDIFLGEDNPNGFLDLLLVNKHVCVVRLLNQVVSVVCLVPVRDLVLSKALFGQVALEIELGDVAVVELQPGLVICFHPGVWVC